MIMLSAIHDPARHHPVGRQIAATPLCILIGKWLLRLAKFALDSDMARHLAAAAIFNVDADIVLGRIMRPAHCSAYCLRLHFLQEWVASVQQLFWHSPEPEASSFNSDGPPGLLALDHVYGSDNCDVELKTIHVRIQPSC
jgi:hypothetical protein